MDVKLPEEVGKRIGERALREYGVEERAFAFQKFEVLKLSRWSRTKVERLRGLVAEHADGVRGGGVLLADIDSWLSATAGGSGHRARTVEHFGALLREELRHVPGHRVYARNDKVSQAWLAYYVSQTEYVPPLYRGSNGVTPAHVNMTVVWEAFGGRCEKEVTFWQEGCRGKTVAEALAGEGFVVEAPELRAEYLAVTERFSLLAPQVGRQFLASGVGFDDLDGNGRARDEHDSWWWHRSSGVRLDRGGEPARVVVDVFRESEREGRESRVHVDRWFWGSEAVEDEEDEVTGLGRKRKNYKEVEKGKRGGKDDVRDELPAEDVGRDPPEPEVPVHPLLAVFDLGWHLRMRCHVSCLTEYEYDLRLHERLVLPPDVKALVVMLCGQRGVFRDVVGGKSGGAVVMCAGGPGLGKTLTADVYAETMGRPLYRVQAAQLGLSAEALEAELLRVFARAQRWGAVLLVDEADVYVRERGDDLEQNAIVGVMLRVLETYDGVLFLTTNRAATIDDAVASRCVARIGRSWRSLAGGSRGSQDGVERTRERGHTKAEVAAAVVAAVRARGSDALDLRDAAHEAHHALSAGAVVWDREEIHGALSRGLMHRADWFQFEVWARAVEQVVCADLGVETVTVEAGAFTAWREATAFRLPFGDYEQARRTIAHLVGSEGVRRAADAVVALGVAWLRGVR